MPPRGRRPAGASSSHPARSPPEEPSSLDPSQYQPEDMLTVLSRQVQDQARQMRELTAIVLSLQQLARPAVPVSAAPAAPAPPPATPAPAVASDLRRPRQGVAPEEPVPPVARAPRAAFRRFLAAGSDEGSTSSGLPPPRRHDADRPPQDLEIDLKMQEIDRHLEAIRRLDLLPEEGYGLVARHPFSDAVMAEPVPRHFRAPQLKVYTGVTDPLDHLQSFCTLMLMYGATDAMMCRSFPSTLEGSARLWYASLGPKSIGSFEQFSRAFVTHFASSKKIRRSSNSLVSLRQREGESLRAFVTRFNKASLEVADLDPAVAMTAMENGLLQGPLRFSLAKKPPATFQDMMARAEKYVRGEEACGGQPRVVVATAASAAPVRGQA